MSLLTLPTQLRHLLKLQGEVSELAERLSWLARVDLPGYDADRADRVKALYHQKWLEYREAYVALLGED